MTTFLIAAGTEFGDDHQRFFPGAFDRVIGSSVMVRCGDRTVETTVLSAEITAYGRYAEVTVDVDLADLGAVKPLTLRLSTPPDRPINLTIIHETTESGGDA